MRKLVLERDCPGQQIFPSEEGAIFRGALKIIEARLKPSRHFHDEIAEINAYIKELECQKSKLA